VSDENDKILFCKREEFLDRCAMESDPPNPKEVDAILMAVATFMDKECFRRLASRTFTLERYNPSWENDVVGCYLYLKNPPVTTIAGIYLDGSATALDSDVYSLHYPKRGMVYRAAGWDDAAYYIDVTYTGGYTQSDNEWDDLKWIHKELAFLTWKRGGRGHIVGYQALNQAAGFIHVPRHDDSAFDYIVENRLWKYLKVSA